MKLLLAILLIMFSLTIQVKADASYLSAVNAVRARNGLSSLNYSSQLQSSAMTKAKDMCARDYWAHGNDWMKLIKSTGYNYTSAGENLAHGFYDAQTTTNGWVNSPAHYALMIGDYKDAGLAVLTCPSYQGMDNVPIIVLHVGKTANKQVAQTYIENKIQQSAAQPQLVTEKCKISLYDMIKYTFKRTNLIKGIV